MKMERECLLKAAGVPGHQYGDPQQHVGMRCEYAPVAVSHMTATELARVGERDPFERRRMRVYIAGPISKGEVWENIQNGLRWGRKLLADGFAPYIPHLDAYLTLTPGATTEPTVDAFPWGALLEWDLEWVVSCEAVFRLDGESKGADLECDIALQQGVPVFYERDYEYLKQHAVDMGLTGKAGVKV